MESTHNSIPDVPGRDDYFIPMPDDATDGSSDHNLIQHANQAFSSSSRVRSRDEGIEHPIQVANLLVPNKIIQLYRDNVSHLRDQLVKVADEIAIEAGRSNEKHSDRNLEHMGELENLLRRYSKCVSESISLTC